MSMKPIINYCTHGTAGNIVLAASLLLMLLFVSACANDSESRSIDSNPDMQDSGDTWRMAASRTDSDVRDDTETASHTVTTLCDDYGTANLNDAGQLSNNVWGYESASFTGYSQCVFYDNEQFNSFGWEWHL
ncbi:MAG: hypothetical protein JXX14_00880, partial [Deltaproteobacteria bacterium]|nr:hypothetical protein [Deltaproteobacteria bacterium]